MAPKTKTYPKTAFLRSNHADVVDEKTARQLHHQGYGVQFPHGLVLNAFETLFLAEKGMIHLNNFSGENVSVAHARHQFNHHKEFSPHYEVYVHLRKKGHIVRSGFSLGGDFVTYPNGIKHNNLDGEYVVHVLEPHHHVSAKEFSKIVQLSQTTKSTPLLAVVDSHHRILFFELGKAKKV